MKSTITFILLTLMISLGTIAQNVTIEGNPYGGNPYASIGAAITAANDGDVILISGEFTETITINKSITLRGTNPGSDIIQAAAGPATTGTGNNVINVVRLLSTDVLNVTIENLSIRNGNASSNGGGINIDKATGLVTLKNLLIENNFTTQRGGGLAFAGSNVEMIECTVRNNTSTLDGGGIIAAPNNASGINSTIHIAQSTIHHNTGRNGGAIYVNGNNGFGNNYLIDVIIENSTLANNNATSPSGGIGGGSIWAESHTWTTNDGGDGVSGNVSLQFIHATVFNNTHLNNNKSGIIATGSNETNLSAYNSILVAVDNTNVRAINFLNVNTVDFVNCIVGGLQNLNPDDVSTLEDGTKNNLRGRTATYAGLSGVLSDEGGNTQVIPLSEASNADDYCTANVVSVTLPTIDQTGFSRTSPPDAGAYEVRCEAPTAVSNLQVAAEAASFSWTASPSESNGYQYVVVLSGGNPDVAGDVVVSASLASGTTHTGVLGLTDATDYDFYIRSGCGVGEFSAWSAAVPFTTAFQGNLFVNSRFTDVDGNPSLDIENDGTPEWGGYGTGAQIDNIIGENVGFLAITEGLLRQDFTVIPGVTYLISFNYRWVSGSSASDVNPPRTPVIRNDVNNDLIETLPAVQTVSDSWITYQYAYTHPANLATPTDRVRFQLFKATDNNQLNFYNITVLENIDLSGDYDFVYKNGAWSSDITTSTATDDVYVYNGLVNLDTDVTAANFQVSPWADVNVENVLDITNELNVETGGVLVFKSSDAGTGQLKSNSVVGEVKTERFIPAGDNSKRAFRFLSSSVNSTQSIRANWQERASAWNNDPAPGFGTHITGVEPDLLIDANPDQSQDGLNGFDWQPSGDSSLFVYPSTSQAWESIGNTDVNTLTAGAAYRLMVRGNRGINLTINADPPSNTILRAKGNLVFGNVDMSANLAQGADEFSFVGNPYQAVVDFSLVTKSNVRDYLYIWDATLAGDNGRGAYVVVEVSSNNIVEAPLASSSTATKFLAPQQAFFVRNTAAGNPTLIFEEADKATAEAQVEVFTTYTNFYINARLYKTADLQNGSSELDAIALRFDENYTTLADEEDAEKLGNPNENFAIINQGLRAIDKQNSPTHGHHIPLFVNNYTDTEYSFTFDLANVPDGQIVWLEDHYLDTSTPITAGSIYPFSVDASIAASTASSRFSLVFENTTLGTIDASFGTDSYVYPNPTTIGLFSIATPQLQGEATVEITNMLGQQVSQQNLPIVNHQMNVDAKDLASGMYIVKISQQEQSFSLKLMVE